MKQSEIDESLKIKGMYLKEQVIMEATRIFKSNPTFNQNSICIEGYKDLLKFLNFSKNSYPLTADPALDAMTSDLEFDHNNNPVIHQYYELLKKTLKEKY